jgi:hypothetical protein
MTALLATVTGVNIDGAVADLGACLAAGVGASMGGTPGRYFAVDRARVFATLLHLGHFGALLAAVFSSFAVVAIG